jgi:hypothetical protein
VDSLADFVAECQLKNPGNDWVVLHRSNESETFLFIDAFNRGDPLRIRAFIIYGERFAARDLGLEKHVTEPEILSHMDQSDFVTLRDLIENATTPVLSKITHIYSEQCSRFDYIIFVLTPGIIFAVVFRVVYGWKEKKVLRKFQPAKYFKGQSIRIFLKKNIKFVSTLI